jgi:hypothetical protein
MRDHSCLDDVAQVDDTPFHLAGLIIAVRHRAPRFVNDMDARQILARQLGRKVAF